MEKIIFVKCKEYKRKGIFFVNTQQAFFEYEGHGDCCTDFIKKHCINLSTKELKNFKNMYAKEYNENFSKDTYKRILLKDL